MLPEYVKYYYERLSDSKKDVYRQMYNAFRKHEKRVRIKADPSGITVEDLGYIFRCLYNDTPSFYYLNPSLYIVGVLPDGYMFENKFLYTEEQIRDFDQRLLQGLEIFHEKYIQEEMSDFEKEVAIHDYLINTVTYDTESIEDYNLEKKHKEIYNTLGPLLRKKAVCWGIACAFKLICDFCRIKCFVVVGNLRSENDGEGHAWNIVRLQDENYHVDVTWDLRTSDTISFAYDYLNLNDHLIKLDHFWDDIVYPSCNSLEYNYHHRYKLYVSSPEQIPGFIAGKLEQGNNYITFKYASKMPEKELIREKIQEGILRAENCTCREYLYSIVENTHNIYIKVTRQQPAF